jgi:hypothetical protein
MVRFGILLDNAEIVDKQKKGETFVLTVQARGVSKNAAKRGARKEASSLIPLKDQNIINETQEKSSAMDKHWLFTIADG